MADHAAPLAVISDVHGNLPALEAVMADARARGARGFVNLGDHLYGPLDPAGTCSLLMRSEMPCILGNQDRILLEPPLPHPTFRQVMERLRPEHLEWLKTLPATAEIGEFLLCHGSPSRDTEYLLEDVSGGGPALRKTEDIETGLGRLGAKVVLCGHTHVARVIDCRGTLAVNPGSVGLPAYDDDAPVFHRMESGSPHARYALVSKDENGWSCLLASTPYDHQGAAALARKNGREDWARWLSTGRCE